MEQSERNPTTTTVQTNNPQVVFSWSAPLRVFKRNKKTTLRFYLAVALLLSLLIFLLGDKILVIPLWAALFLFYVFTITPPPTVENKITKFGVETAGITLRWDALSYFYFKEQFGLHVLVLVSQPPYNLHSYLVIKDETTKIKVTKILINHIVFKESPQKTFSDKLVDLLSHLIPDEERDDGGLNLKIEEDDKVTQMRNTLESLFQKPQATSPPHPSSEPNA